MQRQPPAKPLSLPAQLDQIARLRSKLNEASREFAQLEEGHANDAAASRKTQALEKKKLADDYHHDHDELNSEYLEQLQEARVRYEAGLEQVLSEEQAAVDEAEQACELTRQTAETASDTSRDQMNAVLDDRQRKRKTKYREELAVVEQYRGELVNLEEDARDLMRRRRCQGLFHNRLQELGPTERALDDERWASTAGADSKSWLKQCSKAATESSQILAQARAWWVSRFVDDGWPVMVAIFVGLASTYFCVREWGWAIGLSSSAGAGIVAAVLAHQIVALLGRMQMQPLVDPLAQSIHRASTALTRARAEMKVEARDDLAQLHRRHDQELRRVQEERDRCISSAELKRDSTTSRARQRADSRRTLLDQRWEEEANPVRQRYLPQIEQRRIDYQAAVKRSETQFIARQEESQHKYDSAWQRLRGNWDLTWAEWQESHSAATQFSDRRAAPWSEDYLQTPLASDVPDAIRFGHYDVSLEELGLQLPDDDRLPVPAASFPVPAFLQIPDHASLLLEAAGDARQQAVAAMQNVLLRFLVSLPPGKVRFTILDPTGLGQNFSAFMHLADYDERLVHNRIWTEPNHIQQRLCDLTEHMENVIQKYLRNDYASIQEYNRQAGEVAEPFHVLAVANFPANFSEEAAQRLLSIASAGARCGVFTMVSTDSQLASPRNFELADLEQHANTLVLDEQGARWKQEALQGFPVRFEARPEESLFNGLVRRVGKAALVTQRVEVPFQKVMPSNGWWTESAAKELDVPIGRAGATKLQRLRLGHGTSQHVLIAGKTGSGKSTLLNALITNAAVHYSPDEVQFYLIDFKKGVEFKPYAKYKLPHARVIAIESEREFGLSVLERLDGELRARGDRYRELGVQDLEAFRRACPDKPTPRILLVIDEFQEFFVKEDKLAQSASLLLDRLVRQGRAFGIHVLLGSQTLAGAYSLARSTIGQMAVRVALQCSETDAHLILSEDNDAARLLSRPGQAIYNDANGLFEGNHPFQVVWLSDEKRVELLKQLDAHAAAHPRQSEPAAVVFEGNAAADPLQNGALMHALQHPTVGESPLAPQAWLGASVAIAGPPAAVFRRQSGHNLLVVGQQADLAVPTLTQAVVGLAAFSPRAGSERDRFGFQLLHVPSEEDSAGLLWSRVNEAMPQWIKNCDSNGVDAALEALVACVRQRQEEHDDQALARFLIVNRLGRFRTLQHKDDDFGLVSFGSSDEVGDSPAKHLITILKDGPSVGVHTLLWCDHLNDFHRWLGRSMLHEFAHRVLLPMNATDSSQLMDSPEASRIGNFRAIYHRADTGQSLKIRPYGMPESGWLDTVAEAFGGPSVTSCEQQAER